MMKTFNLTMVLVLAISLLANAQDKSQGKILYKQKVNIHASLPKEYEAMKAMIPEFSESQVEVIFKDKKSKISAKESESGSGDVQISMSTGGGADEYVDYEKNLLFRTINLDGDAFHSEMPIEKAKVKPLKTTKTICGYNCKSVKFVSDKEVYAIYYTTELEGQHSPMPGVFTDGVILAIVSEKLTYVADKISFENMDEQAVSLSSSSEKITEKQFYDLQEEQMEQAMPQGGNVKVIKTVN